MAHKRVLVIDTYNVVKVFRQLGVPFDEIAALGCRIEGEPEIKVTPAQLEIWYDAEREEREMGVKNSKEGSDN